MSELGIAIAAHALIDKTCDPTKIAGEINAAGFSVVENYIGPDQLKPAQDFVFAAIRRTAGNCVIFRGPGALAGTFMHELPANPAFTKLCRDVYEAGTGNKAPESGCYQVLRCLSGPVGRKNSMHFHFDSYVLAALIPIIIPTEGALGDLLLVPNVRKIRKSYVLSLIDKAVLASPFKQRWLKRMYAGDDDRLVRVKPIPGNLYFFWGYTSAHASEEFAADKIRSTALFHYIDPHAGSRLRNIMPTSRLKNILHPTRMKEVSMTQDGAH